MRKIKNEITLLVSSAGRRVELIRCFRQDADDLGIKLRVIATDMNPRLSSGCVEADECYKVTRCGDPQFINQMLSICKKESVDLLIPTIDTELLPFSASREQFLDIGTRVAISSLLVVETARDKYKTFQVLQENSVPCPRTFLLVNFSPQAEAGCFPVILKPKGGSSSQGLYRINSGEDFPLLDGLDDYIVQEIYEGEEYTVNLFFDNSGVLLASVPHMRIETRGGEVYKGVTKRVAVLDQISKTLASSISGFAGVLCYQAIVKTSGEVGVFEINARFGGGYPLAHAAGAHFSKWLLEEVSGRESTASENWRSNVQMLRYDAAFFTLQ